METYIEFRCWLLKNPQVRKASELAPSSMYTVQFWGLTNGFRGFFVRRPLRGFRCVISHIYKHLSANSSNNFNVQACFRIFDLWQMNENVCNHSLVDINLESSISTIKLNLIFCSTIYNGNVTCHLYLSQRIKMYINKYSLIIALFACSH